MKSETSIVAKQVRLKEWAALIWNCQSRPKGMNVDNWCQMKNISKANYYYHLRMVREAYLEQVDSVPKEFVELPVPKPKKKEIILVEEKEPSSIATFHLQDGISVYVRDEFIIV